MEKGLSTADELKTLFSEAETLKQLKVKYANDDSASIYAKAKSESGQRLIKYENMFKKHLFEFAKKYSVSNDDIAKMLTAQIGGEWNIDVDNSRQVSLFASYNHVGVAGRALGLDSKGSGIVELSTFWRVVHFKNNNKYNDYKSLNWIIPYFLNLAGCETALENPLCPNTNNVKKSQTYLAIFNMLDQKMRAIAGVGSTSAAAGASSARK